MMIPQIAIVEHINSLINEVLDGKTIPPTIISSADSQLNSIMLEAWKAGYLRGVNDSLKVVSEEVKREAL